LTSIYLHRRRKHRRELDAEAGAKPANSSGAK
jgi:hypothetical protein